MKKKEAEEMTKAYYCKHCGIILRETGNRCKNCKSDLLFEENVKSKVMTLREWRDEYEKAYPSFKLNRWDRWLFFIIGFLNAGNLIFWITLVISQGNNTDRYDKFWNPATRKVVYIWGYIVCFLLIFMALFFYFMEIGIIK